MSVRSSGVVDTYIGQRIRSRRLQLGLSQQDLAGALNLSFQQLQKYEKGTNRVTTSTLIAIAAVMDVEPAHFYHGAPGMNGKRKINPPSAVDAFMSTKDGLMIAQSLVLIADPSVRHEIAVSIGRISRALAPAQLQAAE